MPSPLIPDPLKMWRDAIGTFEKEANSLANQSMNSEQFAAALHRVGSFSMGMQQVYQKLMDAYLKQLNLPSRDEVAELAIAMQRIEAKLDQLLAAGGAEPAVPRPARTRRPPEASDNIAESNAPAVPAKRAGRSRRRPKE